MALHEQKEYADTSIELDGNKYKRCKFTNCTLIYNGGQPPALVDNSFVACRWEFTAAAARTITFLSGLYRGGGKQIVELAFDHIRGDRKISEITVH